jgi:hypothetical protein
MDREEHKKLDELQKNLYERDFPIVTNPPRSRLSPNETEINPFWNHEQIKVPEAIPKPKGSVFKKILIGSVIFFVIALGIVLFVFFRGLNVISANNLDVSFVGPVSVAAGDELDFDIVVQNKNNLPLANTTVYIDYPDGTKRVGDLTQDLLHETENLGSITAGGNNRRTIRAVLFGEEHATKEVKVTVEYSVKNSNAIFRKETSYSVQISSAPLVMTVSSPSEAVSGDQIQTTIKITSNSKTVLNNILVKASYPFGYTYLNATPAPTFDNSSWLVESLKPGASQTITFTGRIEGQEKDARTFHVTVGAQNQNDEKNIATAYLSNSQELTIRRPALETKLVVNGVSTTSPTIATGETSAALVVTNTLPYTVNNVQVTLALSGTALNPSTVVAPQGTYNPATKTLIWTQNYLQTLSKLNAGDAITLAFQFATLSPEQTAALRNGNVAMTVTVTGSAYDPTSGKTQQVSTSLARTAKLQSNLAIIPHALYTIGPFKNTGPIPARVGQKTTYTITLLLGNSLNPVTDAVVEAKLPTYVNWLNKISPTSENVTWNSSQNAVVWQVGTLNPDKAGKNRQVSFQVELVPKIDILGTAPALLTDILLEGMDTNIGQQVRVSAPSVTTILTADPTYGTDSGIVRN